MLLKSPKAVVIFLAMNTHRAAAIPVMRVTNCVTRRTWRGVPQMIYCSIQCSIQSSIQLSIQLSIQCSIQRSIQNLKPLNIFQVNN